MRTGQPAAGPVTSPPSCGWRGTCWPAFPIANRDPAITMAESARWPPFRAKPSVRVAGPSSRIPVARRAPWPQVRPCPLTCPRARRCKRGPAAPYWARRRRYEHSPPANRRSAFVFPAAASPCTRGHGGRPVPQDTAAKTQAEEGDPTASFRLSVSGASIPSPEADRCRGASR
jgi:hypothetical protein